MSFAVRLLDLVMLRWHFVRLGLGHLPHVILHPPSIHLVELRQTKLHVGDESIGTRARKVFANDHAHQLEFLRMRGHGVSWDDPSTLAKTVCDCELVMEVVFAGIESEGYKREPSPAPLGEDEKAEALERFGHVVGCLGQIHHDGPVTTLA